MKLHAFQPRIITGNANSVQDSGMCNMCLYLCCIFDFQTPESSFWTDHYQMLGMGWISLQLLLAVQEEMLRLRGLTAVAS